MGLERLLEETPEAYYWIGFIMADGSYDHKRKTVSVSSSVKDREHIEKYAKFVDSKIEISKQKGGLVTTKDLISNVIMCRKTHKDIFPKIIKKFKIKERKTYNPPIGVSIKDNDLFLSFLIGYIDGDGSINKRGSIKVNCHSTWDKCLYKWFHKLYKIYGFKKYNKKFKSLKVRTGVTRDGHKFSVIRIHGDTCRFLKTKIKELGVNVLDRKWVRVRDRKIRSYKEIKELEHKINVLYKQGISLKQISRQLNVNYSSTKQIRNSTRTSKRRRKRYNDNL